MTWWYLAQVRIWFLFGQKLGHLAKFKENIVKTLEATFLAWACWNMVRMIVLVISKPSSNKGHVGSNTRPLGQVYGKYC